MKGVLLLALLATLCGLAQSTHFRFATLSWKPRSATQWNTIDFSVTVTWRSCFTTCNPTIDSVQNFGTFYFGNAQGNSVSLKPRITAIYTDPVDNTNNGWMSGVFQTSYTYPAVAANYTAYQRDKGRLIINNNADAPWKFSTLVTVGQAVKDNTQTSTPLVFNTSPVSNNLPIVPCIANFVNQFPIVAVDLEQNPLKFSLADAIQLGSGSWPDQGTWNEVQPPNFSVDADTGIVTWDTNGLNNGYWCAQVVISDGLSWTVVDFMLNVQPAPKVCDASCDNSGTSCSGSGNCQRCTSTVNSCAPSSAPFFIAPTPASGSTVLFEANTRNALTVAGQSTNTRVTVTIQPASAPLGAVWSPLGRGNPSNMNLTWTPTTSDIGSYVVTLALFDSNGVNYNGQYSFIIAVQLPACGYGTGSIVAGRLVCTCPPGFDNTTSCSQCLPGFYGATCAPCTCQQGNCLDGLGGTGACQCYPGWLGADCSILQTVSCNSSSVHTIVSTNAGTNGMVVPNYLNAYINKFNTQGTLSVPVRLPSIGAPPTLDFFLLVDNSKSISTSMLSSLNSYSKTLIQSLRGIATDINFGLATFTDRPSVTGTYATSSNDFVFRLNLALTSSSDNWRTAISALTSSQLGGNDNTDPRDCQLDSLFAASTSGSLGWRATAFKIVVIMTDSGYWTSTTQSGYMSVATLRAALLANNIVPIFATTSTAYETLVSQLGFGYITNNLTPGTWSNWHTVVQAAAVLATTTVNPVTAQDAYGFVSSKPASAVYSTGSKPTITLVMKYPNPAPSTPIQDTPVVIVNFIGFGAVATTVQVNRIPSIASTSFALTRTSGGVTFTLGATDADYNIMLTNFTSLPRYGALYTDSTKSVPIQRGVMYALADSSNKLTAFFVPDGVYFGSDGFTYGVSDGCEYTNLGTASISIGYVVIPPVCQSFEVRTLQNQAVRIPLNGTSVDYDNSLVNATLYSLPSSSAGSLTLGSSTSAAQLYSVTSLPAPWVLFTPVTNFFGSASFQFKVQDGAAYSANTAVVSVVVEHVDQPPVASASSPVQVTRGTPFTIVLSANDPDPVSFQTFSLVSHNPGTNGVFSQVPSGTAIPRTATLPFVLASNVQSVNTASSISLSFLAPSNAVGNNYASFSFLVTDDAGNLSNNVSVAINIKPSVPPVATPNSVTVDEDASVSVTLTGTDVDAVDSGNLQTIITKLPSQGTFTLNDGSNVVLTSANLGQALSSSSFTYTPRSLFFGPDSLEFQVVDLAGSLSPAIVVPIIVNHVNHAPSVSFSGPINTNQETSVTITQILASDIDVQDTLTVQVTSLPANGKLFQIGSSSALQAADLPITIADPTFKLSYLPPYNMSGLNFDTFNVRAWDGNSAQDKGYSPEASATINVAFVNKPPTVQDVSQSMPESQVSNPALVPIQLVVNDVDTSYPNLRVYLTSLPSSSLMKLVDKNGVALTTNSFIPAPWTVYASLVQYQFGSATFQYKGNDRLLNSVGTATVDLTVTFVNTAPVCSFSPPVPLSGHITASRTADLSLTLSLKDPDTFQSFSFAMSSITVDAGTLKYQSQELNAPGPIASSLSSTNTFVSIPLVYSPNAGTTGLTCQFTFTVSDGTSTSSCSVVIHTEESNPPVATPDNVVHLVDKASPEDPTRTDDITMEGTDEPEDMPTLQAVIMTLPVHGNLYSSADDSHIQEINTLVPAREVYYRPTPYYFGPDSFQFAIIDQVGALSANTETSQIDVVYRNFPPTAAFTSHVVVDQNDRVTISGMTGSDPDPISTSTLTAYIDTFPVGGVLYQADGTTPIGSDGEVTDSSFHVVYIPNVNVNGPASFTFYVDDGAAANSQSNIVSVPITVNFVDQPPTVEDVSKEMTQNQATALSFDLPVDDIDTDLENDVSVFLTSLPTSSFVVVKSGGVAAQVGQAISYPFTLSLEVIPGPNRFGDNIQFTYKASDQTQSSTVATVTVDVARITLPPTVSAVSPVTVTRGETLTLTLNAASTQPMSGNKVAFTVTDFNKGTDSHANSGVFKYGSTAFPASAPVTVASNLDTALSLSTTVTFTAPNYADGTNFATLTFTANDNGVAAQAPVTVQVDIAPNNNPVATPVARVNLLEDGESSLFALEGTDVDAVDSPALTVVVLTVPANGNLYASGSSDPVAALATFPAGTQFHYVPTPLFHGQNTLSFVVADLLGARSNPETVELQVAHVNHRPVALFQPISGLQNTDITITLSSTDLDGDNTEAYVTKLPADGILKQANGAALPASTSSTNPTLVNGWTLIYTPPHNQHGANFAKFDFFVKDDSGDTDTEKSQDVTAPITIVHVNQPPTSQDFTLVVEQDIAKEVTIATQDDDSTQVSITIKSFPTRGTLSLPNGAPVTASNPSLGYARQVVYTPPAGQSDRDLVTPDPFDTFSFIAVDDALAPSLAMYTATVSVNPARPKPILIPDPVIVNIIDSSKVLLYVYENQPKEIPLKGKSFDFASYGISLKTLPTTGVLSYNFYNTESGYTPVDLDEPISIDDRSDPYKLVYTPALNVFGEEITNFTVVAFDGNGDSEILTVIITIIHVNVAPVLTPLSYSVIPIGADETTFAAPTTSAPWASRSTLVGMKNQALLISWNVTDSDSPWSIIQSQILAYPAQGLMYSVQSTADGFTVGDVIQVTDDARNPTVPRDSNDGLWRMLFRPVRDGFGVVYAVFSINARDDYSAPTLTFTEIIRIKTFNLPPTVTFTQSEYAFGSDSGLVSGTTVSDPDAGFQNLFVSVTLSKEDGTEPSAGQLQINYAPTNPAKTFCHFSNFTINCTDTLPKINSYLASITINSVASSDLAALVLTVFVDDLGNGADLSQKADPVQLKAASLTATQSVSLGFTVPSPSILPSSNTQAMTGIIAGAAAAGVGAAAGVYLVIRRKKRPMEGFFGEDAFANTMITDSALYEGDANRQFDNPLYEEGEV